MSEPPRPRSVPPSGRAPRKRAPQAAQGKKPGRPSRKASVKAGSSSRRRAVLWALGGLAGVVGIAAAVLFLGFGRRQGPRRGDGVLEVDWPAGLSSEEAATRLFDLGLADDQGTMVMFLRATGGTSDFIPGPHFLPEGATPWELRRLLSRSFFRPSAKLTVPEGYNRFDIAARVEKLKIASRKAFLAASADPVLLDETGIDRGAGVPAESAEGYLFPATYEFGLDTDPREVVKRLAQETMRRWEAIAASRKDGLASLQASLGWSRREVLTLASIIEKEAAADEERPLIASVFLNRLLDPVFHPKRLQSDPTSIYGCLGWPAEAPSCAEFTGKPSPAINRDPRNRYSTYVHNGLPPGPIANPGVKSIEAVLTPAATRFFYFVAAGGGRHTFSQDLDAHNDAVHKGKSP